MIWTWCLQFITELQRTSKLYVQVYFILLFEIRLTHLIFKIGYPIDNYPMFTTAYLKMLSGFNTIRFMDWAGVFFFIFSLAEHKSQTLIADTNSNIGLYDWSQRTTLSNVQWGSTIFFFSSHYSLMLLNRLLRFNCWRGFPIAFPLTISFY